MFYIFLLCVFLFGIGTFLFAPWVPTKPKDVARIFDLVAPSPEDVFYELGCGDGRLTLYFAEKWIQSRWFEISVFLFLYCLLQKWRKNARNADFIFWDFFRANLKEATIVYLFGTDKTINDSSRLREKLRSELKPGTKVISYLFRVDWLKLVTSHKDPEGMSIYVYEI